MTSFISFSSTQWKTVSHLCLNISISQNVQVPGYRVYSYTALGKQHVGHVLVQI